MKGLVLIVFMVTLIPVLYSQGRVDGFFKGKGNLDIAIGTNYEANPKYYAGTNLINLQRNILSASAFFAYGITNKLDVNVSIPFVSVNGVETSIQDPAVFLKYKIAHINFHPSITIDIILAGGFSSNITDYKISGGSALGQQAKTIDIRPVIQINHAKGIFMTLQGGYNYKFDPVPNAIPFAAKFGIAKANWYADVWYDGQHGIGGFDYQGTPSPPSFRELGVSYHKIGGTFYKPINQKLGWFGGLSYVLAGRNFSKGVGANVGLVLKPDLKK
jgi:hypothetical protein